jgi:thioredoxin 1
MKKRLLLTSAVFSLFLITCRSENPVKTAGKAATGTEVIQLTNESFKKLVFNYAPEKAWLYQGSKPAIIDFYADWCAPCRQLSPLVEEVAKEYGGKIVVYKVDTMKEKALTQGMGITGLPTLMFIPSSGNPKISVGYIPKEYIVKAINEVLLIK